MNRYEILTGRLLRSPLFIRLWRNGNRAVCQTMIRAVYDAWMRS